MTEEVNTGGLHTFSYKRKDYTDEEDKTIRKRWGSVKNKSLLDFDDWDDKPPSFPRKDSRRYDSSRKPREKDSWAGIWLFFIFIGIATFFILKPDFSLIPDSEEQNEFPKFSHNNISYAIDFNNLPDYIPKERSEWEDEFYIYTEEYQEFNKSKAKEKINDAFSIISEGTSNILSFYEVSDSDSVQPDILLIAVGREDPDCSSGSLGYVTEGLTEPEVNSRNEIIQATIKFCLNDIVKGPKYTHYYWPNYDCMTPSLEIHEILHALGLGHTYDDLEPLLNPISSGRNCRQEKLTEKTRSCLTSIYSKGELNCTGFRTINEEEIAEDELDFKWESIPVKIAFQECSVVQIGRFEKGIEILEKYTNTSLFNKTKVEDAQVLFYCENDYSKVPHWENFSFYTDKYSKYGYVAALPEYIRDSSNSSKVSKMKITMYALPSASSLKCGGVEIHELLHALGLRKHEGRWMTQDTPLCTRRSNVVIIDDKSIDRIRGLYGV